MTMTHDKALQDPRAQALLLAAINKRLSNIEAGMAKTESVFMAEDAVAAFRKHLREGKSKRGTPHKKPWNYDYLLDMFLEEYSGQNIAAISPASLDTFIEVKWPDAKTGTIKQRKTQLKVFFSWAIMYLKRRKLPTFPNPCELLDPVHHEVVQPEFMPTAYIGHVLIRLMTSAPLMHRIAFEIMLTAGLRISELMHLRKHDVDGRVLTLRYPKSGLREEKAAIPDRLAKELKQYLSEKDDAEPVIAMSEKTIFNFVKDNTRQRMSPHDLRKWCITFWHRKKEEGMVAFVSRHKTVTLTERYVAPLTIKEAMAKQNTMEEELYGS